LLKLVTPFLLDPREIGGLGLKTQDVGIAYGTVGVTALTLGGLLGGWVISRGGLKRLLWPLMLCMHIPNTVFVALAVWQPSNLAVISAGMALEQFGYGFGFTAYMVFMLMVAGGVDGSALHKTAHYALCTGFMALGMMLPGMWAGWLQDQIGYLNFFIWACVATLPSFAAAMALGAHRPRVDHRGQGFSTRLLEDPEDASKGHMDQFDRLVARTWTSLCRRAGPPRAHRQRPCPCSCWRIRWAARWSRCTWLSTVHTPFAAAALITPMHEPTIAGSGLGEGMERAARRWCDDWSVQLPFQLPWPFGQRVSGQDFDLARAAFEAKPDRADNDLSHSVPRLMRRWADRAATCEGEHCGHRDAKVEGPTLRWVSQACSGSRQARGPKPRRSPCRCCCSTVARTRWCRPPRSRPSASTSTHRQKQLSRSAAAAAWPIPCPPPATRCWWRWTASGARRWRTRWRSLSACARAAWAVGSRWGLPAVTPCPGLRGLFSVISLDAPTE
jgi:hypothetical protein